MSHLDFVRPSGVWAGEQCPGSSDYQRIDVNSSKIVDGDNGGTWNPTSPIGMGGAGMTFTTAATQITGGVTTKTGGRLQLATVSGNTPTFASAQSDKIVISCADLISPMRDFGSSNSWLADDWIATQTAPGPVGAQSIAAQTNAAAILSVPSRYTHQGSSWSKMVLHFRVLTKPNGVNLPSLVFSITGLNTTASAFQLIRPGGALGAWQSGFGYGVGAYVFPQSSPTNHINGYYYKCTIPGTSDSNAAIFDGVTTIGATVSDTNGVQWTCTGQSGQLSQFGLDPATYFANGQPQTLEYDFDNGNSTLLADNAVDHTTRSYVISFGSIADTSSVVASVNIELHSVELWFSNITTLGFT